MDRALLSALAAILGSLVGASATIATAWLTQRTQARRAAVEAEIQKREALYGEFIAEGSKVMIDALDHKLDSPEKLYNLYAILNRIRLLASDEVLAAADRATTAILERYFQPNLSPEEMQQLMLTRPNDPLEEFSEVCRLELRTIQRQA